MSTSRVGRPTLLRNQPSASVHCRVPTTVYDRACDRARAERTSVQELLRRGLRQVLEDDDQGEEGT